MLDNDETRRRLQTELDSCCSVEYHGVQKAVVVGEEDDEDRGLAAWVIAVVVAVAALTPVGLAGLGFVLWHIK